MLPKGLTMLSWIILQFYFFVILLCPKTAAFIDSSSTAIPTESRENSLFDTSYGEPTSYTYNSLSPSSPPSSSLLSSSSPPLQVSLEDVFSSPSPTPLSSISAFSSFMRTYSKIGIVDSSPKLQSSTSTDFTAASQDTSGVQMKLKTDTPGSDKQTSTPSVKQSVTTSNSSLTSEDKIADSKFTRSHQSTLKTSSAPSMITAETTSKTSLTTQTSTLQTKSVKLSSFSEPKKQSPSTPRIRSRTPSEVIKTSTTQPTFRVITPKTPSTTTKISPQTTRLSTTIAATTKPPPTTSQSKEETSSSQSTTRIATTTTTKSTTATDIATTTTTPSTTITTTTPTTTTTTTTTRTTTTPITTTAKSTGDRYCPKKDKVILYTNCVPCRRTRKCKKGFTPVFVKRCWYRRPYRTVLGCQRQCLEERLSTPCCDGYAGPHCDPCPGGRDNPCNGNGICLKKTAACRCYPRFSGPACDQCHSNKVYGQNCTEECQCEHGNCSHGTNGNGTCVCDGGYKGQACSQEIPFCSVLGCEKKFNMKCAEVDGKAVCLCKDGYRINEHGDCSEIYPCDENPALCPSNTKCIHLSPGRHNCSCEQGYLWDGDKCVPSDPCKRNKGMCSSEQICFSDKNHKNISDDDWYSMVEQYHSALNTNTSMDTTLQNELKNMICGCKKGYQEGSTEDECVITELCRTNTCHVNAVCKTVEAGRYTCTCKPGYTGNGLQCNGNIMETVNDIVDSYKLDYGKIWLNRFFQEQLTSGGQFTIFLPDNQAYMNAFKRSSRAMYKFLEDTDRATQVMRQHILIGKYKLEDLRYYGKFYTLQGNSAEVLIRVPKNVFKFKLHESFSTRIRSKTKIIQKDIEATNGYIHVINKLLTLKPGVTGDATKNALQLIKTEPRYNIFESLIEAVGLEDLFSQPNITVFAPENSAWESLHEGTLDYLKNHTDYRRKLQVILKNHIIPGRYDVFSLLKQSNITSLQELRIGISVTERGRIQLYGNVDVTQVQIPCNNGFYHHVSGLLIPDFIRPLSPHMCKREVNITVKGHCGSCLREIRCQRDTDIKIGREMCKMFGIGCRAICTRESEVDVCCDGFYGYNCKPCPGGYTNPCNGQGQCFDGKHGNGTCTCDEGFSGTACELCEDDDMFGPFCNQTCTCLHGECDNGPTGTGMCKPGTCNKDWAMGDNCDKRTFECGDETSKICHTFGYCVRPNGSDVNMCKCKEGYYQEGDDNCVRTPPCIEEPFPCHIQAKCEDLGRKFGRKVKCTCLDGWEGDGRFCFPIDPCEKNKTLCKRPFMCFNDGPGKHVCVKVDPCINPDTSCHPKASCTSSPEGFQQCKCPPDMFGDGYECYGTIYDQVLGHSNLTSLAMLLESIPNDNMFLNFRNSPMTLLAPSDDAMESFGKLINPETFWKEEDSILFNFLEFHTLLDNYTADDFTAQKGSKFKKFPTFYDGFSLHFVTTNGGHHIFVNHSDFAKIVTADIPATNGRLHIIDHILEPFFPDNNPPDLKDTMVTRNKHLSLFEEACSTHQFYKAIEAYNEFTVFAPINKAITNTIWNEEYLSVYRYDTIILTPSIMNGDDDYYHLNLIFTIEGDQVFVNNVRIIESDILVEGGVMHVIDGLLHVKKRFCDRLERTECCPGFYGPECRECPMCRNRTHCHDGIQGDGTCKCNSGFKPPLCQECLDPDKTGPHCNISVIDKCDKGGNLNCSDFQDNCAVAPSGYKCRCPDGTVSIDNKCPSPCKKVLGRQCNFRAKCVPVNSTFACKCIEGYHGDGVDKCVEEMKGCETNNGGCDTEDRASCISKPTPQINNGSDSNIVCKCVDGFVGDGRLCSTSLMDAASRIPQLETFMTFLSQQDTIELMRNLDISLSLFLPISQMRSGIHLTSMAVMGSPIVLDRDHFPPQNDDDTDRWTVTSLNGDVITITVQNNDQFYINNVSVVRKNIKALNGILHLTSAPIVVHLTQTIGSATSKSNLTQTIGSATSKSNSSALTAGVAVGAVILAAILVLVIVLVYRRWKSRDVGTFMVLKSQSDSSISFSRLQANESDESFRDSDCAIAKYDNPVFEDLDDLQILT